MLAVDICTKRVEVVPMMMKDKDNILAAFYELFKKLGGNPKIVYSDNDTAIDAPIVPVSYTHLTLPTNREV